MGCSLLTDESGSHVFGALVQGFLFSMSVGVLVLKKTREAGDRTWFEFGLDSSKQLIGAGWIHVANMLCSVLMSANQDLGNPCEWYWLNIMIDTTFGVWVEYVLLMLAMAVIARLVSDPSDFQTGEYWDDDKQHVVWLKYFKQLAVWLAIIFGMKVIVVGLLFRFPIFFESFAHSILAPVMADPRMGLVFVMILTPCCMNALQFWLVDSFIKKSMHAEHHYQALSAEETSFELRGQDENKNLRARASAFV